MGNLEEARRLVEADDRRDFDFAERGFIATREDPNQCPYVIGDDGLARLRHA